MAIQPDGKIVSVGDVILNKGTTYEMSVVRLNPDGSLDTSFHQTGYEALKVGVFAEADAVALQPDGKILIGGQAYPTTKALQGYTDNEFVVARFNANGTLDTTFANKGIFTWNPTPGQDLITALAVLADGSIVGAAATGGQAAVLKLSASGALVSSFGNGGVAVYSIVPGGAQSPVMAVAPNGDLILAGFGSNTSGSFLIAVNSSTGGLDPSFNNGQGWLANFIPPGLSGAMFYAVTIQGSNIVVAGQGAFPGNAVGLLGRFSLTGAVDTTFTSGGFYTTPGHTYFYDVAVELDGSIVVDGRDTSGNLPVGHFTANGQIDTTFGGAGTGFALLPNAAGWGGLAIGANGSILALGSTTGASLYVRLTPPEAMIGSFTASANPVSAGSSETLTASNIANSSTITQVAFYYFDASGNQVTLGYGTQTSPGVWTFTFNVYLTAGSYTLYAQAEDSYGVFGDPFALPFTVQ